MSISDEQRPLLGNGEHPSVQGENNGDAGNDDVPLAEEPSTSELLLVMSSIWVGTFLASLGMRHAQRLPGFPAMLTASD